MDPYSSIGKLVATFGLGGELVLLHTLGKKSSLKGLEALFLETGKEGFLPYFIESAKIKSDKETYLKLEGVDSPEKAKKLLHATVWLPEADFQRLVSKSSAASLVGFRMIQGGELLGEILEIVEQPQQLLCRIDFHGKEALIPLHEQTLLKVDKKKRLIEVRLPEGLLDIYR